MPDTPNEIARATVEKFTNRYAAAARAIAEDIASGEYDADEFASVLHGYADSALTQIAQEAGRAAFLDGRSEGLTEMVPEIERSGKDLTWRRSAAMETNTCSNCADLDGSEIDDPSDDLGEEHEGPQ